MTREGHGNQSLLGVAVVVLGACSSGGCSNGPGPNPAPGEALKPTPTAQLELNGGASCDALRDYVSDSIADLIINGAYPNCIDCVFTTTGSPGVAQGAGAAAPDASVFDEFTGTNNQESGVDELDVVEADSQGNFYILDGRHLVVANGLPPAGLSEIGNLELTEDAFARGMLLDEANQRLVVALSAFRPFDPNDRLTVAPEFWTYPMVELLFVDVSDPANPVVEKQLLIEGFELGARRIGSRVHLVSHFVPAMPVSVWSDEQLVDLIAQYTDALRGGAGDADQIAQAIRDTVSGLVAATDVQELLPEMWVKDAGVDYVVVPNPNCAVALPEVTIAFALTSVTSVDTDGTNVDTLTIGNNSWNVYASQQNLYLIQPSSGWWWDRWQMQETAIYKIGIGSGRPEYKALGKVKGSAWSSFQFSEHQDHLRVVTNRNEFDPAVDRWLQDNNLYVLADDGAGSLRVRGSVLGFGVGESIFATRMLGERGFVVTFRRIDPLFAFDLSDPVDPRLMGELEIPGVSTYIHPLDSDHLLTIGFAGDEQGLEPGFQLQIFDVQDLADPRLLHAFVPEFNADGFAWTPAMNDHLAFNYFDTAGILTIPVQYWANRLDDHFSGFAAFSVSVAAGFGELGRLDHSDMARQEYCPDPTAADDGSICEFGYYLEAANPKRSVAATVGDDTFIYTFSDVGVKASNAQDFPNPLGVLPLPYPNQYWWWIL